MLPHVITTYALPCCSSSSTIGRVWSSAIVPTVAFDQTPVVERTARITSGRLGAGFMVMLSSLVFSAA